MSERDVSPSNLPFSLKPRTIGIIIVVIAIVVAAASSVFVVDQTERGVVLLLGRYNRTAGAGLHFKLPFGIEQNYNVVTERVQSQEFGYRTVQAGVTSTTERAQDTDEYRMLTGDLNIIDISWNIQYRITDPQAWLFNVEDQDKTIRDISRSVINAEVGDRGISDILIGSGRQQIQANARQLMNETFAEYGLGINVTAVNPQNWEPPAGRVQTAFEDVNKAIQDMNRLINEGRQTYNEAIPRARGEAQRLVQVAEGYAAARVNEAQGDVARFLQVLPEYNAEPQTTRTRLYVEMIEDVFGDEADVELIDRNLSNFIPLLNLQREPGAGAQAGGAQ
ncbi:MAG: FtsH protease activity modulator HflK [Spirochaetales bacterium]